MADLCCLCNGKNVTILPHVHITRLIYVSNKLGFAVLLFELSNGFVGSNFDGSLVNSRLVLYTCIALEHTFTIAVISNRRNTPGQIHDVY